MPKKKNHMPEDISNFAHAISGLTEVIGESFTCSRSGGRMLSWSDGEGGYFLTVVLLDDGRVLASVHDHSTQSIKTYAAIGYLRYHRIDLNITMEASWEPEGVKYDDL